MEQDLLIKVLLSTVLGFLGGWLVKTVFANGRLKSAERDWQLQLKTATEGRDAASLKVRQLRSQVGEMESSFATVEKDMTRIRDSMEQREQSFHNLRKDLIQAKGKIEETDRLRAALAERDEKLRQFAGVRAELLKSTAQSSELQAARLEITTMVQRSTQLETENASLNDVCEQLKKHIEQLTSQQAALIKAASDAPPEAAKQADQTARVGQLESQLKARDHALAQLQKDFSDFKALAEQKPQATEDSELQRRLNARDQSIKELYKELESSRSLLSGLQQRINEMEQDKRRENIARPGGPTNIPSAEQKISHEGINTTKDTLQHTQAWPSSPTDVPLFYDKPPETIDDLTQIKGIGPVLANTLNAMGIFQFQQLANMSEEDVAIVTHKLRGFKDRIQRDHWVVQARELAAKRR